MSTAAAPAHLARAVRFYESSIGKKAVMAVTGLLLFVFVVGHLLGNLQFFLGREALDSYGAKLRDLGPLLWIVRAGLFAIVATHIIAALQLWRLNRDARPARYRKLTPAKSTLSSRTMLISGPLLALFVGYHLYHLTLGPHLLHDERGYPHVYDNVVAGFSDPIASGLYVLAMVFLGLHIHHGVASMFQSVGFHHPRYTPILGRVSAWAAVLIVAGNISIPISILTGLYRSLPGH
jgi:succinate dehydrogenase / fumarate reductase cytochrome b subunit